VWFPVKVNRREILMFRFLRLGGPRAGLRAAAALVSALVCAGVLAGVSFAGVGGATTANTRTVDVVTAVDAIEVGGNAVTVAPGGIGSSAAICPPSDPLVVGGGWQAHGSHEVSVMSVVESESTARSVWFVRIVNPLGAGGDVSFRARAMCMGVTKVPVLGG
jgi:hypothetical protein